MPIAAAKTQGASSPNQPAERSDWRFAREAAYSWIGILITLAVAATIEFPLCRLIVARVHASSWRLAVEDVVLVVILGLFLYGQLIFQLCRLGYYKRMMAHRAAERREIEAIYDSARPAALTIVVPSYREHPRLVHQTLMSAALAEYPGRRVVLLIDDPLNPADSQAANDLAAMRHLPQKIEATMHLQKVKYDAELAAFERRVLDGAVDHAAEFVRLGGLYREAANWLEAQAAGYEVQDYTDALFVERILREPARAHRERGQQLAARGREPATAAPRSEPMREYKRLASLFSARLSSFERKRFVNLSHVANKSMNLNGYFALIGRHFRVAMRADGAHLEECEAASAQLDVPDADYVLSLDADSLIMSDYALRLSAILREPGNRRIGIIQSPHRAIPGSPRLLQRVAGSQSTVSRLTSQGSTYFGASFWVGSNALFRREALEEICEVVQERGFAIKKYARDRTLVEDTESTIDFLAHGWEVYNYPDPLAYSATPPDFGSLIIQRLRWAGGGLLNVGKLLRYLRAAPERSTRIPEAIVRFHYLASTAINVGMLVLPVIAIGESNSSVGFLLSAAAYYILYARDLVACEYGWLDLPRVYALNLLLIPVSLEGLLNVLRQAWTGRKPAFRRTPKVFERTPAPARYILMPLVLLVLAMATAGADYLSGSWPFAIVGLVNAALLSYALAGLVGLREGLADIAAGLGIRAVWPRAATTNDRGASAADPAATPV